MRLVHNSVALRARNLAALLRDRPRSDMLSFLQGKGGGQGNNSFFEVGGGGAALLVKVLIT